MDRLISEQEVIKVIEKWRDDIYTASTVDLIKRIKAIPPAEPIIHEETLRQVMWERDIAIEQLKELGYGFGEKIEPSAEPKTGHWKDFAAWVANEIFDDEWEYNKDAFAEIACRKLNKLGIVKANGNEWELTEPQEGSEDETDS